MPVFSISVVASTLSPGRSAHVRTQFPRPSKPIPPRGTREGRGCVFFLSLKKFSLYRVGALRREMARPTTRSIFCSGKFQKFEDDFEARCQCPQIVHRYAWRERSKPRIAAASKASPCEAYRRLRVHMRCCCSRVGFFATAKRFDFS